MKTIKVPASDRARCIACGRELAPLDGPREAFARTSEETKSVLLACYDCRGLLPEAWAPVILEKLGDEWMKIEPTGPEIVLGINVAQHVLPEDASFAASIPLPTAASKVIKIKDWALKLLVGDASDQAKCTPRRGFMILPGDLCLIADEIVLDAGQVYRDLVIVRDPDLKAGDAPFAYVVSPDRVRAEGRVAIIRFKGGNVQRSFVKKFAIKESERRFVLTLVGEVPADGETDLPSTDGAGEEAETETTVGDGA